MSPTARDAVERLFGRLLFRRGESAESCADAQREAPQGETGAATSRAGRATNRGATGKAGEAWGYHPYDGMLYYTPNAYQRASKGGQKADVELPHMRGDAEGRTACERGPAGESCLGCTRKMHVLCECAFRTRYRAGPLVKSTFVGENARRCCLARSVASPRAGGAPNCSSRCSSGWT